MTSAKAVLGATLIIVLALFLRLYMVTGDIMYDPAVYAQDAYNLLHGTFRLDTDSWYSHRLPVFVPVTLVYAISGVGNYSTNFWPLLLSLVQMAAVMWLGYRWLGREAALLAGLFMAIMPLDVIYAGILNPDMPIATFITLSAVCWILGIEDRERPSRLLLLLSGLFCALAVGTRMYALLIALFFGIHWAWRRVPVRSLVWWAAGFAAFVIPVVLIYTVVTGDPLLRIRALAGFYGDPGHGEGLGLLYYPSLVLSPRSNTGLFALFFAAAAVWAIVRPTRKRLLLLAWIAPILLYLQFGSMSLTSYVPVFKRVRFLTPFVAPSALLAALVISEDLRVVGRRIASVVRLRNEAILVRIFLVLLVGLLLVSSLWILKTRRATHTAIARSFERAATLVRGDTDVPVLFDHWRTSIRFAYYLGFEEGSHLYEGADETQRMRKDAAREKTRLGYLKWYDNPEELPDAFVVLEDEILAIAEQVSASDPSRSQFPAKDIPAYCNNPPASWTLLGRFGKLRVFRTGAPPRARPSS